MYFEHDQWTQASELLRRSLNLQDRNDVAHLLLGLSLAELKQFDESERELQTAVQQNPQSDLNWYFAGWRLLLRGKYEASLPYFYKAVELNPKNPNAHRALGSALARTGSYGLAEDYYRKAIEIVERAKEPTPDPYLDLAYLLLFSNRRETAARHWNMRARQLLLIPGWPAPITCAGKLCSSWNKIKKLKMSSCIAAKLNPQDGRPFFLLAQIYDRLEATLPKRVRPGNYSPRLTQRRADESKEMSDSPP